MIVAHVLGGLGNQMFQYAAGRALALRHNTALALDTSGFSSYGLHQGFELQKVFALPCSIASPSDISQLLGWRISPKLRRLVRRFPQLRLGKTRLILEPHFHYWPDFEQLPARCYLSGYWQSARYFCCFEDKIRADFSFKHPLTEQNAEIASHIVRVPAVSLHVRRGDYANNPKTTATHGLCSPAYYSAAIRHISERVLNAHLFIFSDDLLWVQQNLSIDLPHTFVQHNKGAESYNDMLLMSLCQHHIIANSSFSWWGAWLNNRDTKIVIAPRNWFAKPVKTCDLIPEGWHQL